MNWERLIDGLFKLMSLPALLVCCLCYQQTGGHEWLIGLIAWVINCAYYFPVFKTKAKK